MMHQINIPFHIQTHMKFLLILQHSITLKGLHLFPLQGQIQGEGPGGGSRGRVQGQIQGEGPGGGSRGRVQGQIQGEGPGGGSRGSRGSRPLLWKKILHISNANCPNLSASFLEHFNLGPSLKKFLDLPLLLLQISASFNSARARHFDRGIISSRRFMSLRGKGSTLGARKFSKLLGSKFTLVFLVLQPRSDTLEG